MNADADALHRAIADFVDDGLLSRARARLDRWAWTAPDTHVQRWRPWLDLPAAQVRAFLISDDREAVALRDAVPFLSVFDVDTRRRVVDLFAGAGARDE